MIRLQKKKPAYWLCAMSKDIPMDGLMFSWIDIAHKCIEANLSDSSTGVSVASAVHRDRPSVARRIWAWRQRSLLLASGSGMRLHVSGESTSIAELGGAF
jgi:hypothetical protein